MLVCCGVQQRQRQERQERQVRAPVQLPAAAAVKAEVSGPATAQHMIQVEGPMAYREDPANQEGRSQQAPMLQEER